MKLLSIICFLFIIYAFKTKKLSRKKRYFYAVIYAAFGFLFLGISNLDEPVEKSASVEEREIDLDYKKEQVNEIEENKKGENKEKTTQKTFKDEFAEKTSQSTASKLDLLFTQLGLSNPRLSSKEPDGLLFDVVAGGEHLKVSADKDDVYSIFIPNVANFYMDGEIKQTLSEYKAEQKRKQNEQYDLINVNIMAEDLVKSYLVNPGSAKFPSIHSGEISFANNGNVYAVQAYVDSKNRMGARVREKYLVEFRVIDMNTYSYDPIYVQIGNQKVGEYIDFE